MKKLTTSLVLSLLIPTFYIVSVNAQLHGDLPPADGAYRSLCVNLSVNLGRGTSSDDVMTLQDYLSSTGYMNTEATGYFGNITMNAVKSYQSAHSIQPTGYVGPYTRAAIQNESCGGTGGSPASPSISQSPVVCPPGNICIPISTTSSSPNSSYIPGSLTGQYLALFNNNINTVNGNTAVSGSVGNTINWVGTIIATSTGSVPINQVSTNDQATNSFPSVVYASDPSWYMKVPMWSPFEACAKNSLYKGPAPADVNTGYEFNDSTSVPELQCMLNTSKISKDKDPYWDDTDLYVGEASRATNYVNPWLSATNPLGIVYSGKKPLQSNLCKNPVTLAEAKAIQDTLRASGSQINILGSSTLYIAGPSYFLPFLELFGAEVRSPLSSGTTDNQVHAWDGAVPTHRANVLDWYKPEFQKLIETYPQFGGTQVTLARCLDVGFKSNFTLWSKHVWGKHVLPKTGTMGDLWDYWKSMGLVE